MVSFLWRGLVRRYCECRTLDRPFTGRPAGWLARVVHSWRLIQLCPLGGRLSRSASPPVATVASLTGPRPWIVQAGDVFPRSLARRVTTCPVVGSFSSLRPRQACSSTIFRTGLAFTFVRFSRQLVVEVIGGRFFWGCGIFCRFAKDMLFLKLA